MRCYDTQHNDIQPNDTQNNDTQHNDTQHNDTQHKQLICDSQHNKTVIMLSVSYFNVTSNVIILCRYADCRYSEYRYTECCGADHAATCWQKLEADHS